MASDLPKVDAYQNTAADYEELPELTDEDFARGVVTVGGISVKPKRGRPAPNGAKRQITLRLDPGVIDGFKATGAGWQGRLNDVLRDYLARKVA